MLARSSAKLAKPASPMASPPPILITSMDHFPSAWPQRFATIVSLRAERNLVNSELLGLDRSRSSFPRMTCQQGRVLNRMQPNELERGRLRKAAADVEGLHRLARRAFHQV